MKALIQLTLLAVGLTALAVARPGEKPARGMEDATQRFLGTLTPAQRSKAVFAFTDDERMNWHFVPRERRGLPLREMEAPQRTAALGLLRTSLSARGYLQTTTIMALENVLRAMENNNPGRDPDGYFFSVFGTPGPSEPWGWRFEGHHLALNFTLADGKIVAAPTFFGSNPADVREGPQAGTRALAPLEDLGRQLVTALTPEQKKTATLPGNAPDDILTGAQRRVDPLEPAGIPVTQLDRSQRALLSKLVAAHADALAPTLAAERRSRFQKASPDAVRFAWAGSVEKFQGHYYRIQGPTFLIEYDNTQNRANHIHSVWRDLAGGDFGEDVLREHFIRSHQKR